MNTHRLLLLLILCLLFPNVLLASDERVSVRERILELIKETPIDPDVVHLEPYIVQSDSIDDGMSREFRELENSFKLSRGKNGGFGHFKIPFKFDSVDESDSAMSPFIQNAKTFKAVHGGIRLSDNATLYFKTGILWGEERKGKLQFYLPFRYRSSVGIGWKKKF